MKVFNEIFTRKDKLLMVLAGGLMFLVFVGFSYIVAKEMFNQIDFDLTVKFQDRIPRRLDYIFSWFSVLGSVEVTGVIWGLIFIIMLFKRFIIAALSLFLLPLALAIEVFGKIFVHHPAPPFMFYRGVVDIEFPKYFVHDFYSYPSGHETRTAFLITFLMSYLYFRKSAKVQFIIQPILIGILVVMSVSRVYLGEHWSSDVIGGFLMGVGFGLWSGVTIPVKHGNRDKLTATE